MDLGELVANHPAAIIGLAGVIVGGLISAAAAILGQSLQRKWNLDAQRREWLRNRREQRLDKFLSWLNQWLRTASRVRRIEDTIEELGLIRRKFAKIDVSKFDKKLEEHNETLRDLTAISHPIVLSLNDEELKNHYEQFTQLVEGYQNAFEVKDLAAVVATNREIFSQAKLLISKMQRRADEIISGIFED